MALSMTGSLVPIIRKNQFDDEATSFLKKYYPEALLAPMPVPIVQVAKERMGLSVLSYCLSEDLRFFGQMCFTGGLTEIYDKDEDEYREILVDRGTMIVDPETFFQRNIGCLNNTVAHECFHWHRHRNYHAMKSILDDKQSVACRCQVEAKDDRISKNWTNEEWMEWQANGIAPRILLPKETFGEMAECFLNKSRSNNYRASTLLPPTQWIIEQLASFYAVSKTSVRIRLDELGIQFE